MKLSEWSTNLVKALEELNATRERDAFLSVSEGLALVKLRVINSGVNANGNKFVGYSTNELPWFYFTGYTTARTANGLKAPAFNIDTVVTKMKAKLKRSNKGKTGDDVQDMASYRDFREAAGRPVGFKNFSLTGDMWASIRGFIAKKTKTAIVVEVKSSFPFYNDTVIPAHSNREGINILKLAKDERKLVFDAYSDRRRNVLRKNHIFK